MDSFRDTRWSIAVAKKAGGKCIHCGDVEASAHHIIGRSNQKTRYLLENGLYCCHGLHRIFEGQGRFRGYRGKKARQEAFRVFVGVELGGKLKSVAEGRKTALENGFKEIL